MVDDLCVQGIARGGRELLDSQALVGHLVAAGSVYTFLAEHRRRVFPDAMFADLFESGRGPPSVPGEVIASVLVLQALEGRSDRGRPRRCGVICGGRSPAGYRWVTRVCIRRR